jgi:dihydroorotate dehydrogenase (NAD+) catalytic subunit
MLDLNGVRLRNRVVTSSSLLGYGARRSRWVPYGLSPFAQWVPLERFGAVTTRTLTLEPRAGHFTLREDWRLREFPKLLGHYARALQRVDAGWLNAFGWSNIGIDAYFREYFPKTHKLNRIISVGGFAADEFCQLVERVNAHVQPGEIAAIEFNVSCHNVNFDFERIVESVLVEAIERSQHPVLLKLSPDYNYLAHARLAERYGVAGLVAINTVKGLRLDPETGEPLLKNRFGGLSGRAIKPIGLRVVAELRDAGIGLPIIATGGIRTFDDCREYFWAGADAVSLGSEVWLAPYWGYALGPLRGVLIQRLISRVEGHEGAVRARSGGRGGAARELPPALGRDQQLLHR